MNADPRCDYCQLPMPSWIRTPRGTADHCLYCCYGCRFAADITQSHGESGHAIWLATRLGASTFLSMGVMVFALALYSQDVYKLEPAAVSPMAADWYGLIRYVSLLLATPVFFMLGLPILSNAIDEMRSRIMTTDALIVLGVVSAFFYSYYNTLRGQGAVYYDTACMILVLVTLGRYLEATGKIKASTAVKELERIIPDTAVVIGQDGSRTVAAGDLAPDDLVLVTAGERIAVDGVIESGRANIDEQVVTGESIPTEKETGDPVYAGSVSVDGKLEVRVTAIGAESTFARMLRVVDEAKAQKSAYERMADRVTAWFVPAVLVLAAIGAARSYARGSAMDALLTGLSVLLISCPCALGIATPMAIWVAMGCALRRGVLFRSAESIERLAGAAALAIDKTGTLTTGEPTVEDVDFRSSEEPAQRAALANAAGLSAGSSHVLSGAIRVYAKAQGNAPVEIDEIRTVPGRGVAATHGGQALRLGSLAFVHEGGAALEPALAEHVERWTASAMSIVCLQVDGHVECILALAETLREDAKSAMTQLDQMLAKTLLLTGDNAERAAAVAGELDMEGLGRLLPEEKIARIKRLRSRHGPVVMVGDGLNDAPALAAADVGIAMGCGADITRESADVCLLGERLVLLPFCLDLARCTVSTIRTNLFWAFAYNIVGISLAMSGKLSPILAAGAMAASSLIVVANSLRLERRMAPQGEPS